jgi:hypothetical protein
LPPGDTPAETAKIVANAFEHGDCDLPREDLHSTKGLLTVLPRQVTKVQLPEKATNAAAQS